MDHSRPDQMLKKARRWTSAGWQLCSLLDSFITLAQPEVIELPLQGH